MNANKNALKIGMISALFSVGIIVQAQEITIKQSELPNTSQEFIAKHFSGKKISQVQKDKGITKTEFELRMEDGTKIEFDGEGNWKEVDGNNNAIIPTGFIPSKITTYVSKNFPTHSISKIEKDSRKIEVELTNGLDLEFNSNGDFVKIDD